MNIEDLKCCANCLKFEEKPEACQRRERSDYELDPSDCCVEWEFDGYIYSQRIYDPYFNNSGN